MFHKQLISPAAAEGIRAPDFSPKRESLRLSTFGSVGGLFLIAGLGLVASFYQSRSIVYLVFLFMVGVAPLLSASLVYLTERRDIVLSSRFPAVSIVVKSLLLCFVITLIAFALITAHVSPHALTPTASLFIFLATGLGIIVSLGVYKKPANDYSARLDAYLVIAAATAVFVFSPFDPAASAPIGLVAYALTAPHFAIWAAVGVVWTAAGVWLRRREGWAFPHKKFLLESLAILAAEIVILGLYDDGLFVDVAHYMPLIGPALHDVRGGIPMVDTYSQYGFLPWFIYRVAFAVFAPTFSAAAVVDRLINLAYFTVFLLMLFSVSRRRLSAMWFFVPALLVAVTSMSTPDGMLNMNALPMTLGGRNILPACITLLLAATSTRPWTRWAALALIMLSSLSSIEILVFTLAPWGYCLLLDSIRVRSVSLFLRSITLACGAIALAQGVFIGIVYFATGALVDYGPYFNFFFQFRPSDDSFWSLPFVTNYALWFPIGFAYFMIMAAAFYRALRGETRNSEIERLLPVAVLGLGPLAYFFGRPQEATLSISCLSFAVVAIRVAESIFINARRFGPVGPAISVVMACAFSFIIADGFEHFMRPLNPRQGNATVLRRCFTEEGCQLTNIPVNMSAALYAPPLDPRTKVKYYDDDSIQRIDEAISMLRRLAPNDHDVGILTDINPIRYPGPGAAIGATAFMSTGQWYAWAVSSPINDGASPTVTNLILKQVAATPSKMLVIISNDHAGWVPLNQSILDRLVQRCQLSLLETGKYLSAFETENCGG